MGKTKIHILIIEDNAFDALLIQHRLLQGLKNQIQLTHAESLSEALLLINQQHFDLILSDLHLPDSNGVETITKLKTVTNIPIAVLTVSRNEQLAIQCINAGAQDYLQKDILSESSLTRLVRYTLERQRAEERTQKIEQRFQTIFEKAPLGIAHINLKKETFIDINPRYAYITGRTIDALMQLKQKELIHPDDAAAYACDMMFLKKNKPDNWKTCRRIIHAKGSTIWVEMTFAPFEIIYEDQACYVCMIEDVTEHKRMLTNLRDLTMHLQNIREEESIRIGREVHDVIGGNLAVIKLELDWLSKKVTENALNERILLLHQLTGEAIDTVRSISQNLRPNVLDNLGLVDAIEWLARDFEKRMGICCNLNLDYLDFPDLTKDKETSIFRILQEALINIAQHAAATSVEIYLTETHDAFYFKIKDNGKGISKSQQTDHRSFGIMGMRERAQQLGGKLIIEGASSKGTVVIVKIPILKK
ncbi:MAG: response regulator [Nitrosomonas sp.]|nr:response regulator [Nitrosomonas sp.]MCW5608380.1 response regulator [Nitrosomonas sp.]